MLLGNGAMSIYPGALKAGFVSWILVFLTCSIVTLMEEAQFGYDMSSARECSSQGKSSMTSIACDRLQGWRFSSRRLDMPIEPGGVLISPDQLKSL